MAIECYHTGCENHSCHENDEGPFCHEVKCDMKLMPNTHTDSMGRIVLMRNPITIPEITREVSAHEKALRPEAKFVKLSELDCRADDLIIG